MISKNTLFSFMLGLAMVQVTSIISSTSTKCDIQMVTLLKAIEKNNITEVQNILKKDPDIINRQYSYYEDKPYPMQLALRAAHQDLKMLELLFKHGGPNIFKQTNLFYGTLLHQAIAIQYISRDKALWILDNLPNDYDIDAVDIMGATALRYALPHYPLPASLNNPGLCSGALKTLDKPLVKKLLQAGANPQKLTILHGFDPLTTYASLIVELQDEIKQEKAAEALALGLFMNEGRRNTLLAATLGQQFDNQKLLEN